MKKHLLKLLLLCCVGILALSMFACVPTTEQYKLDFIVDGEVYHSRTTSGNSRIVPPSDPRKFGYIFKGWYFDENSWENEYHAYSLEKNPITEDTKIYAWFEYDETHTCEGEWIIESEATCSTEGKELLKCKAAGCKNILETKIIAKDPKKHSGSDVIVKTDVVLSTCTTTGSYVETIYCSVCNEKKAEPAPKTTKIDENAHCYPQKNATLSNIDDVFYFTAQCEHCHKIVSLENVEVTEKIIEAATCDTPGSKCYVYTAFGKEYSSAVETIDALGHSINGVAINNNIIYSEKQYKDIFPYITLIANASSAQSSCEAVMDGVFKCDNCFENTTIKVNKPHTGTWVQTKAPTCFAEGVETLSSCTACGEKNLTRAVAATGDHRDGSVALVKVGDKFNVVVPCANAAIGCTHIMSVVHEDVEVTSKEIISTSCAVPDVIRYTYKASGKTLTCDEIIAEGHFIDGVRASVYEQYDEESGKYWFDYHMVGNGITVFYNQPIVCDGWTNGKYTCTSCKGDMLVNVYRPHTGDWITTKEPTCTETGVSNFYCEFCDYGDDGSITKEIPISAHDYDLALQIDTDGTFDIVGKCFGCSAEYRVDNITVSAAMTKQPTCTAQGEILYSCNYNGKNYTTTGYIPMTPHSLDGVLTNEGTRFEYLEYVVSGKVNVRYINSVVCVDDASDTSKDVDATFVCSVCGKTDVPVKVYRIHDGSWKDIPDTNTSPCVVSGKKVFECMYHSCDYVSEEVYYQQSHNYNASIEKLGNTYTVTVKCVVDGCGETMVYSDVSAVDVIVKVTADCCTDGVVEYVFASNGKNYKYTANVGKGNHVLMGVDYETLINDGKIDLSNAKDVIIVEVGSTTYFKCDKCGQLVSIPNVQIIKPDEE